MKRSACIREVPALSVTLAYIAVTNGTSIDTFAPRFARTYQEFPGGYDHELIVVCNGGMLNPRRAAYFDGTGCQFMPRENDGGKDISAYQHVAARSKCDFLVCIGESCYFRREGWLSRLVQARITHGRGMYGYFATHAAHAHLNTSAFGCDRDYLTKYPPVTDDAQRYQFEHYQRAMWRRIQAGGGAAMYVTWSGVYPPGRWRESRNGLNEGIQSDLMIWCNHTDRFAQADPATRASWTAGANQFFR